MSPGHITTMTIITKVKDLNDAVENIKEYKWLKDIDLYGFVEFAIAYLEYKGFKVLNRDLDPTDIIDYGYLIIQDNNNRTYALDIIKLAIIEINDKNVLRNVVEHINKYKKQ